MTNKCSFPEEFQDGTSGQQLVKTETNHAGQIILELLLCKTYGYQQMLTKFKVFGQNKILKYSLKEASYDTQQCLSEIKKKKKEKHNGLSLK